VPAAVVKIATAVVLNTVSLAALALWQPNVALVCFNCTTFSAKLGLGYLIGSSVAVVSTVVYAGVEVSCS
jgi:hypothetical protein